MLYAILAYHVEDEVTSWTPEEDSALMLDLNKVHDRLQQEGSMGPAARLGATNGACVLQGAGAGVVRELGIAVAVACIATLGVDVWTVASVTSTTEFSIPSTVMSSRRLKKCWWLGP